MDVDAGAPAETAETAETADEVSEPPAANTTEPAAEAEMACPPEGEAKVVAVRLLTPQCRLNALV